VRSRPFFRLTHSPPGAMRHRPHCWTSTRDQLVPWEQSANPKPPPTADPNRIIEKVNRGIKQCRQTTLMSAFPSSRRVNLWLPWKQWFQSLPVKAGGAAVVTTVDPTLMRGSKPHDR
jgi:hypothetical protein